jgi:hypothetical protein
MPTTTSATAAADRSDIVRRARASGVFAGREWIVPLLDEPLILNPRDSALDQTGTKKAASGFERAPGCALSARWLST